VLAPLKLNPSSSFLFLRGFVLGRLMDGAHPASVR
jgi:hypothetical protein